METKGPEFLRFAIPIIEVLKENGNVGKPNDITAKVITKCNISEEDLNETLKHGGNRIKNQVHWARFYLMKSGYIDSIIKGKWQLTEKAITSSLKDADIYPLFKEVRKNWAEKVDDENNDETSQEIEDENKSIEIVNDDFFTQLDINKYINHKPLSISDPQRIKIQEIISKCDLTNWVIPHFQRYFDWNKLNIKELLESIFNEYYVGSFLLWRTNYSPEIGIEPILGINEEMENLKPTEIILDGQQRITALYYAIKAPNEIIKGSKNRLYFYINFYKYFSNNEKDIIEIHTDKLSRNETFGKMLFPVFELEDFSKWAYEFEDYLIKKSIDNDIARNIGRIIQNKLRHIWSGFEIPYISLPENIGLTQVTDIFENINTKGKQLNVFDLLIARLYKFDIELKNIWDETLDSYPIIKRYFLDGKIAKIPVYILQAISLFYSKTSTCKRADILDINTLIYNKNSTDRVFIADWEDMSYFMSLALEKIENMRDGFGVRSEKDLPFSPMIPVLTALLKLTEESENKAECYKKIKIWYWSAIFTTAYSSAADTQMTLDYREMKNWFSEPENTPKVVHTFRKDILNVDFLEIQSTSNAKYKGILSLIAIQGAKDFDTEQRLESSKQNDKDHIFPKSMTNIPKKYINSILNMTWMSEDTNRKIKTAKTPSLYTIDFIKNKYNGDENRFKQVLNTHFIDDESFAHMKNNDFEKFIQSRQNLIIKYIKNVIGIEVKDDSSNILISKDKPFSNKLAFQATLEQCSNYIFWLDKYFSNRGLEFLSKAITSDKIKEIKIIMGLEKVDSDFRKVFKDFVQEFHSINIQVSLHVIIDPKIKSSIHDRFIISDNIAFNIPSPDIIARNQLSEITKSNNGMELRNLFNELWLNTSDIISDWDMIFKANIALKK